MRPPVQTALPGTGPDLVLEPEPSHLPRCLARRDGKRRVPRTPEQFIVASEYVRVCERLAECAPREDPDGRDVWRCDSDRERWIGESRAHDVLCDVLDRFDWEGDETVRAS